jgi:hypothetical protein
LGKLSTASTLSNPRSAPAVAGVARTPIDASGNRVRSARKAGVAVSRSPSVASFTTRMRFGMARL